MIFALPAAVYFAVFWLVPLATAIYLSFTQYDLVSSPTWLGLDNYRRLVNDPQFWNSLRVTLIFSVGFVVPTVLLALLIAVPLSRSSRTNGLLRALFFLPAVMPLVASAILWQVIYASNGLANTVLGDFHIASVDWLTSPSVALWSVIIMVVWKYLGLYMLIFMAGLQTIPHSVYEAAALDGARTFRTFFQITIPLLKRTLLFVAVIAIVGAAQAFIPAYILTAGGPINATEVLPLFLYQNAFSYTHFGYACTMAVILFIILLVLSRLQFQVFRSDEA
jgi:multiple sugar transport system permease protein